MVQLRRAAKTPFEAGGVAIADRRDECFKKTSSLGALQGYRSAIYEVPPSASYDLPRIGLFKPKDVRDITVWTVECLSKDVRRSFHGR